MTIHYIEATWTPTTLAADFHHYELERSQDGGATWDLMAYITTEAADIYRDYDGIREVDADYRLRVIRADGAASDWTAPATEQTPAAGWAFTTNEAPDLALEFDVWRDTEKRHSWEFPANEKEWPIAGRDGAVVLKGLEDPLDAFTVAILIVDEAHPERAAFDQLLEITREPLAYLTVHSPESRRWLANVTIVEGSQDQIRQVYTAPARVRELTKVPVPIDVAEV